MIKLKKQNYLIDICTYLLKYETRYKMNILEEQFLLFEVDEKNEELREIKTIDETVSKMFDHFSIFIIVDPLDKEIWIWVGENASIRKKFIATQKVPTIRDRYGIDFKIVTIDEGSEPLEFKEIVGL
jgi:hypothetical protein